jgi:hypothetical protein
LRKWRAHRPSSDLGDAAVVDHVGHRGVEVADLQRLGLVGLARLHGFDETAQNLDGENLEFFLLFRSCARNGIPVGHCGSPSISEDYAAIGSGQEIPQRSMRI